MGLISRHNNHLARLHGEGLTGYRYLCLSLEDINQRVKWRRMLAKPFPLLKSEDSNRPRRAENNLPAYHGTRLILGQIRQFYRPRP